MSHKLTKGTEMRQKLQQQRKHVGRKTLSPSTVTQL